MTDEEKIRRIKDIAAQKAFVEYGRVVGEMLKEAGIKTIEALANTTHVHSAIMFDDEGHAVAVRAQWDVTADKAMIERAVEMAKEQGKFPSA
jgi:predicted RecB family nuclease